MPAARRRRCRVPAAELRQTHAARVDARAEQREFYFHAPCGRRAPARDLNAPGGRRAGCVARRRPRLRPRWRDRGPDELGK